MKNFLCILSVLLFFGCKEKQDTKASSDKMVYDMYEPSEMAILMNQMYADNLKIKKEILAGEIPKEFPIDFLKIHTADLSDFKARNEKFKTFSTLFINAEKEIFNPNANLPIKDRFNNAVGICISCHQTECTGPIPRIKKLLIK
ncbi:MAG: hypothetical protein ACPG6B_08440 [Oceanihabitans sp.]